MNDFIYYGVISEVQGTKARAAIRGGGVTGFLPVFQLASDFKCSWTPITVREQCVVLVSDGKLHEGCILRGFYHSAYIPPAVSDTQEITKYSDDTTISYDVGSGTMEISGAKQITINCENATVEAKSVSVKADSVLVDSPSIDLGKGGKGVLTAECPCPITGTHSMPSNTVRAKI